LSAGTYSVTVTDANCNLSFENINVLEPDVIQIFIASKEDVSCFGFADGSVELNVFGGVKPYSYSWNGPISVTGDSIASLLPGVYTCEVEDANGCLMGPIQVDILAPDSLGFTSEIKHVDCFGGANGEIVVNSFGGVGNYLYDWNDTLLTGRINHQLEAGEYVCTLSDENGCEATGSIELLSPSEIEITSLNLTHPTCLGKDDGVISVTGLGGTGGLSYFWEGFPEGPLIQHLSEGTYTLVVEDAIGCQLDTVVIGLSYKKNIQLAIDSVRLISCSGMSDGYISVYPIGGQFPYQYSWGSAALDNIPAGSYSVLLTDNEGCQSRLDSFELSEPDSLILDVLTDSVQCFGEASGSVFGFHTGGVSPFKYLWNTGDTIGDLVGVNAGVYQLTITDAHNCSQFAEAIVAQPDSIIVGVGHIDMVATCGQGASLGSIEVNLEGGVLPFSFDWNNGDTTQNIYNLNVGDYSAVITDLNGCITNIKPITIYNSDLDFEVLPFLVEDIHCNSINDGKIIGQGIGGTMPYNFNWSNGNTTSSNWLETPFDTIEALSKGSYNLTITDAKGCTAVSDSLIIDEPTLFHVNLDSVRHNPCGTHEDGQIFTTPNGGTPPYHYLWSTLSFMEDPDSLSVGIYTVTVVDGNDCLTSLPNPVVLESLADEIVIHVDEVVNQNCSNLGEISISVPLTVIAPHFLWSTSDTTKDLTDLFPGYYSVTVTDENGCSSSLDSIEVSAAPNLLAIVLDSIYNVSCFGGDDGVIGVSVDAGIPPYSYFWSTNQSDSLSINGLSSGAYSVTVVDGNSCVVISNGLNVGEPPEIQSTATITNASITQNGQILLEITGGIAPFTFQWDASANNQVTNPATNLVPGDYNVTVTDYNGCTLIINNLTVGGLTGISTIEARVLHVYPNPNDGVFLIDWSSHTIPEISIISPIGIRYTPLVIPQGDKLKIIVQDIPDGLYFIELSPKEGAKRSAIISIVDLD